MTKKDTVYFSNTISIIIQIIYQSGRKNCMYLDFLLSPVNGRMGGSNLSSANWGWMGSNQLGPSGFESADWGWAEAE